MNIDWGDGESESDVRQLRLVDHTYKSESVQTITITGKNIKYLNCSDLTNLDVSKCPTLEDLECEGQFTSLDLSKNTALKMLDCKAQLTSLNAGRCTALEALYCVGNKLTSLDVSKNTALVTLWCSGNQLTSLDVSKNVEMRDLQCQGNQLSASALNALFRTLIDNSGEGILGKRRNIQMTSNPGTDNCDRSIAENRGWVVNNL